MLLLKWIWWTGISADINQISWDIITYISMIKTLKNTQKWILININGQCLPNLDAGYYPLKLKWGDIEISLWKNEFVNCVIMQWKTKSISFANVRDIWTTENHFLRKQRRLIYHSCIWIYLNNLCSSCQISKSHEWNSLIKQYQEERIT